MTLSVDSAGLGLPLIRVDVAYTVEKSTFLGFHRPLKRPVTAVDVSLL